MATVIGVRFKKANKVYYFDPSGVWPNAGEYVVVETVRGIELGEVVTSAREVDDDQIVSPLKKVVRLATEEDLHRVEVNLQREEESMRICQERIEHHKLDMKLVDVEYTFDGSKLIFYFTSNGRVDFRELVKDLAGVFKMRIELRQIGVRDEAKMIGGLGSCGRPICCRAFLSDFQPVSIKMAKEQNLSLNPAKISGQCGRLMCCLKYEQDHYESIHKRLPRIGRDIVTPDGIGVLTDINAILERVKVKIRTSEDAYDIREFGIEDVGKPSANRMENGEAEQARFSGKSAQERGNPAEKKASPADDTKKSPEGEGAKKGRNRRAVRPKGPKLVSTDHYYAKMNGDDGAVLPKDAPLPTE